MKKPSCRPAPRVAPFEFTVMPGADTVMGTDAAGVEMYPGAAALTVVLPGPSGSNATPPAATLPGELNCVAPIVTVRDCADPADVVSCATAALVLVNVTVTPLLPARTACSCARFVLPRVGGPVRTMNG